MAKEYSAESIQVLTGLEPVRKRPGIYTDTTRPNHLVQEVVDNSVDEALSGFAQDRVTHQVASGVVDQLEAIDIDHEQSDRFAGPLRTGELVVQFLQNGGAVEEPGQAIVRRLLAQRLARAHQFLLEIQNPVAGSQAHT